MPNECAGERWVRALTAHSTAHSNSRSRRKPRTHRATDNQYCFYSVAQNASCARALPRFGALIQFASCAHPYRGATAHSARRDSTGRCSGTSDEGQRKEGRRGIRRGQQDSGAHRPFGYRAVRRGGGRACGLGCAGRAGGRMRVNRAGAVVCLRPAIGGHVGSGGMRQERSVSGLLSSGWEYGGMGVWGVVALSIATAEAEPTVWVPSVYKTVPRAYEAKMKPKTPEISKAPSHFSEKARQLWKSIHAEYELA